MKKRIVLPFALSALVTFLNGCGGESAKINENPNNGVGEVTSSSSCDVSSTECLQFVLDYPIAGLNFDCSSDQVNHFATKLDGNIVTGACKLGDTATFYLQGKSARKISLGSIQLNNLAKLKTATLPRIRIIDLAMALTGESPNALNMSDKTVNVAMALVKIFQGSSLEQGNIVGDIQPIEFTDEKKDLLSIVTKDITVTELVSGEYAEVLKPWIDVTSITNDQSFNVLKQLLNLVNTGVWQADLPTYKAGGGSSSTTTGTARPEGFFGCNKEVYADCVKSSSDLLHSMGNFIFLTDRQGYSIGYGQQWRGPATITNNVVIPPIALITKVKPSKLQINAQNAWFNPITQEINTNQPLRFSLTDNPSEDVKVKQGKVMNGNTIAGTEGIYRALVKAADKDIINSAHLGLWEHAIAGSLYKGTVDIVKVNPSSYLAKDIFRTKQNVQLQQRYVFPLYATLTFKFKEATVPAVDVGIVIDESGDIRTDIKQGATATDKSGVCATIKSLNSDGTITDSNDQTQYRIGSTGATLYSTTDKSVSVRMILSNPKFGTVDGAILGLNLSAGSGAKINIHNLLAGQATGINITDFSNNTVTWNNTYATYQSVYVKLYDELDTEGKNKYVAPTADERELAKRYSGTVSIKIADQTIPACNAIKIKS